MALSECRPDHPSSCEQIVDACVFALGHNDKYIIVKQHPVKDVTIHKNTTNYYIVPVQDTIAWRTIYELVVPLTKTQFDSRRRELGIENIEFTIVYKDLE